MATVIIRNLPDSDVLKLDEMAASRRISREELLRKSIQQMVAYNDVKYVEDRYTHLVETMLDRLEENNLVMVQLEKVVKELSQEE